MNHRIRLLSTLKYFYDRIKIQFFSPVIRDFFTYVSGAVILRSISILIMPFVLRIIPPSQFGKLALITSFINIGVALFGFGLRQILAIDYFGYSEQKQKELVNTILIIYGSLTFPLMCFALYFRNFIQQTVFLHEIEPLLISLAIVHIFLFFLVELTYQLLQYSRQARLLIKIQISSALVIALLTFSFIWFFSFDIAGIVAAQLFGMFIPLFLGINAYFNNEYHKKINYKKTFNQTFYYVKRGIPFIQTVLFAWILAAGDRWVLASYGSLHDVGIYALADTASQLFYFLILYPWTAAYLPFMLKEYNENKNKLLFIEKKNQKTMVYSIALLIIAVSLGLIIGKPLLHFILPITYYEALSYMWILLMGQICLLGGYFASCFIQFHKHGFFLALSLAIPALVNIGLNIITIPIFGLFGCAYSTLFSYAVYFALTLSYNYYLQSKIVPTDIEQ